MINKISLFPPVLSSYFSFMITLIHQRTNPSLQSSSTPLSSSAKKRKRSATLTPSASISSSSLKQLIEICCDSIFSIQCLSQHQVFPFFEKILFLLFSSSSSESRGAGVCFLVAYLSRIASSFCPYRVPSLTPVLSTLLEQNIAPIYYCYHQTVYLPSQERVSDAADELWQWNGCVALLTFYPNLFPCLISGLLSLIHDNSPLPSASVQKKPKSNEGQSTNLPSRTTVAPSAAGVGSSTPSACATASWSP